MRGLRIVILAALALALCGRASAAAPRSWAAPQIGVVVGHGLLAKSVADFRPQEPLTGSALAAALQALWTEQHLAPPQLDPSAEPQPADPSTDPPPAPEPARAPPAFLRSLAANSAPVTMRQLQIDLVAYLGLDDAAQAVRGTLVKAGLQPPAGVGSEVVTRLLELRFNHPAGQDDLELLPTQPATRAEAAYSLARMLRLDEGGVDWVRRLALSFTLPELTPWQQRVLARAVHFVGYPYVWGGTSEYREAPFGRVAPGGFDCSGFVWPCTSWSAIRPGPPSPACCVDGRPSRCRARFRAPSAWRPTS